MQRRRRSRLRAGSAALAAILVAGVGSACSPQATDNGAGAEDTYPAKGIEWIVPNAPGSGNDIIVRKVVEIIEQYDLYPHDQVVLNLEGGSGSVGYTEIWKRTGDPYVIAVTSSSFITTPLASDTVWKTEDFTPVAQIARDDYIIAVSGDSDIQTFEDFVEAAQDTPPNIGLVNLTTAGFLVLGEVGEAADYEWTAVPVADNGQLLSALFSDAIDALITNPGEILGQLEVGELRGIAVSSEERMTGPGLDEVPTLAELGYETSAAIPRGLVLAPDAPAEAQEWWIETIQAVIETDEWAEFLQSNNLSNVALFGQDWGNYYLDLKENFEVRLREAGVID